MIAQNREQHFIVQIGLERPPIDIEIGCVKRARSIFEHVLPPSILRIVDPHVIGDEIDNLSHAVSVELGNPSIIILARPDRGIELVVIGNVVAV